MRRIFTLITIMGLTVSSMIAADINTPLFGTFEDGNATPFVLNADGPGADIKAQTIAENPVTVKNTSGKSIKIDIPGNVQWYHKSYLKIEDGSKIIPASANHKYLHIFVMYPGAGNGIEIGVFNQAGDLIYQKDTNFESSTGWEDVVFDLTADLGDKAGIANNNIAGIWVRPFTGAGSACYLDQFELSDDATPRVPAIVTTDWDSVLWADFEAESKTPFNFSFEASEGLDINAQNPSSTGINKTNGCLYGDFSKGTFGWSKIIMTKKADFKIKPLSANHKYLHFMSYRNALTSSELQIENTDGIRVYQSPLTNTIENVWEEIILDLTVSDETSQSGVTADTEINKIILAINPSNWEGDTNPQHYYFDQFILNDNPNPIFIGQPTKVSKTADNNIVVFVQENNIHVAGKQVTAAGIYDISGKLIAEKESNSTSIQFGNLSKGIYVVKAILTDGSIATRKIVL